MNGNRLLLNYDFRHEEHLGYARRLRYFMQMSGKKWFSSSFLTCVVATYFVTWFVQFTHKLQWEITDSHASDESLMELDRIRLNQSEPQEENWLDRSLSRRPRDHDAETAKWPFRELSTWRSRHTRTWRSENVQCPVLMEELSVEDVFEHELCVLSCWRSRRPSRRFWLSVKLVRRTKCSSRRIFHPQNELSFVFH